MIQCSSKNDIFEPEIQEYLTLKSKPTQTVHSSAFIHFLDYYRNKHGKEKGFSDFLDRIFDELKKPRREQRRVAEIECVQFISHLKQLEKSNNTIRSYFGGIQNFLKYKGITVSAIFIGNLPPSIEKKINHKHEWTIEHIREFVKCAPTVRDKSIVLALFQNGLGVAELFWMYRVSLFHLL
jgi:hypothetical protein